ncbi:ankyrin repeat domain-containing protein [Pantoea anthophila]|uniref:ankyrin repeat domain-containing protein n=2 Tax=Pantoea anthophila TaxID=470931 RepID=UPI002DBAAFBC|nr:ankyrin repeat domain-containing protein [Pantoea anthophila]
MKIIVFMFTAVVLSGMAFICFATKGQAPESYFSGQQLLLAKAIAQHRVSDVNKLAPGVELNKPGAQDMTLLFFAVQSAAKKIPDELRIICELVKAGADPLQNVPDLGSVAEVLATSPYPVYMQALLDGGMSPDAEVMERPVFFRAASDNTIATLALMVKRGANINSSDSLGRSVLMHALDGMQLDTVEWLLNNGANPNAVETNTGWSFMRQLDDALEDIQSDEGSTRNRLTAILRLAKKKGARTQF